MRKQVYMTAVAVMAGVLLASGCSKNQDEMPFCRFRRQRQPQNRRHPETETTRHRQRNQQKPGAIICFREQRLRKRRWFTLRFWQMMGKSMRFPKRYPDVETEIAEDVQIAIAYIGEPFGKLEDVDLVVALPEQEEWTISTEEGTTTANAMSSFAMKTADGRELSFFKG